jgi:hypothetical protein
MARARIQALAKASKELADKLGGKIVMSASSDTELEAVEADGQKEHRGACHRMVAKAVQSEPELQCR